MSNSRTTAATEDPSSLTRRQISARAHSFSDARRAITGEVSVRVQGEVQPASRRVVRRVSAGNVGRSTCQSAHRGIAQTTTFRRYLLDGHRPRRPSSIQAVVRTVKGLRVSHASVSPQSPTGTPLASRHRSPRKQATSLAAHGRLARTA
jgi:hypothetical protein